MSVTKNKDILSLLQSRIALRANFLAEYAPNGATDLHAVGDQKADKKAIAEIVKLRRAHKALCKTVSNYSKNTRVQLAYGV
jgi:cell division protein FtsB